MRNRIKSKAMSTGNSWLSYHYMINAVKDLSAENQDKEPIKKLGQVRYVYTMVCWFNC